MVRNETQANRDIHATAQPLAEERAKWAAVLARPANRMPRTQAKRPSALARIRALFV